MLHECVLLGSLLSGSEDYPELRFDSAVLRPLTGYEEDWLGDNHQAANCVLTSRLLDACVSQLDGETSPANVGGRMFIGDRDYLVLQIRRLTLGDGVRAVGQCPNCQSKIDIEFDSADVRPERPSRTESFHEVTVSQNSPRSRTVRFRLPTGDDVQRAIEAGGEHAADHLFELCLTDDGGLSVDGPEKDAIIAAMEKAAPRVEIDLELACPECGHNFVLPFDVASFFFEEMRSATGQLLHEVHSLAFYYHWSENEILRLTRARRRAYLSLLSDALRTE